MYHDGVDTIKLLSANFKIAPEKGKNLLVEPDWKYAWIRKPKGTRDSCSDMC